MAPSEIQKDLNVLGDLPGLGEATGSRVGGGRNPGSAEAWLLLPRLVEIAAQLGVPRGELDTARGVFVTPNGVAHVRSDSECSRRSSYQRLRLPELRAMCPDCAHLSVDGRTGFETQPLLQLLATAAKAEQFLARNRGRDLARLGTGLESVERDVESNLEALSRASGNAKQVPARVLAAAEHLYQEVRALGESIPGICATPEFRAAFEAEVLTYPGTSAPRHTERFGHQPQVFLPGGPKVLEGEQLILLRKEGWKSWLWAATRTYPVLSEIEHGLAGSVVLQIPAKVTERIVELLNDDVRDGPVPVPDDPKVLETALVLYTPMEGAFSTLQEAVKAAALL